MPRSKNHTRRVARSRPRGIMQLNPEGYGFVRTSEGEFFVPHAKLGGAFDGDLVEIAPLPANASKGRSHEGFGGGRYAHKPAARVVSVVERAHEVVVGRFEAAEPFGVVMPLDPHIPYNIFTQLSEAPDVEDGAIVRVRIAQFPSRNSAATGHIEEVLEHVDRLDEGVDAVVARHKFETAFSDAALAEARGASIDEVGALASGYRDLRERFVFTIDPDDARDFDDALSIEQVEDQGRLLWRIGVHIADVSHYVEWGSALDLAARRRATSVYLVDRVIPMIPEELSCGLCSLAPGEVRRSMTVDLYVNERAQLARYEIYPALICSNALTARRSKCSEGKANLRHLRAGSMLRAQTVLLWRTAHWAVLVVRNCARSTLPALIRGLKTSPSLSKGFIAQRFLRMRGVLRAQFRTSRTCPLARSRELRTV